MWAGLVRLSVIFVLGVVVLGLTACTGDVTESDEYLGLQTELEEQTAQLEEAETSLSDAEARANEAETALDEELNRPWPEDLKTLFVAGCAEVPEEGLTVRQQVSVCQCMVDGLEESFGLTDFLLFSIATVAPDVELNPITGLPIGMAPEFIEGLASAATTCFLQFEA